MKNTGLPAFPTFRKMVSVHILISVLVASTLLTSKPASSEEPVEFQPGLDREQAMAVYSALKEDLVDSFSSYLESNMPYVGDERFQVKGFKTELEAANVSLSEAYPAVFVYLGLYGFCGSGGCTTKILLKEKEEWRVIGSSFGCSLYRLETQTNGLRDILERCEKYSKTERTLKYDGSEYLN